MKSILFLLVFTSVCHAQIPSKKAQTLNFTEVWVWEYPDNEGEKQNMALYHHPKKGYWLFTQEAVGPGDEMTEWILAKPNGEYIQRYRDEHGNAKTLYHTLHFDPPAKLPRYYQPTGASGTFGDKSFGFPEFKGKAYQVNFEKTTDQALYYFVKVPKNLLPVYYFNRLNIEAKLPLSFPTDLPRDQLVLGEEVRTGGKTIHYRFRFISHTEYYIEL